MEENCGGGKGLNWAIEPRRERQREIYVPLAFVMSTDLNKNILSMIFFI
jgi:hypothetical protein